MTIKVKTTPRWL